MMIMEVLKVASRNSQDYTEEWTDVEESLEK